jgi:hypothetical protein
MSYCPRPSGSEDNPSPDKITFDLLIFLLLFHPPSAMICRHLINSDFPLVFPNTSSFSLHPSLVLSSLTGWGCFCCSGGVFLALFLAINHSRKENKSGIPTTHHPYSSLCVSYALIYANRYGNRAERVKRKCEDNFEWKKVFQLKNAQLF